MPQPKTTPDKMLPDKMPLAKDFRTKCHPKK